MISHNLLAQLLVQHFLPEYQFPILTQGKPTLLVESQRNVCQNELRTRYISMAYHCQLQG